MTAAGRSPQGSLLIQVAMATGVLAILLAAVTSYALTEWRAAHAQQRRAQAFYLAEAGLDRAIGELRQSFAWTAGFSNEPYGTLGVYSVSVESLGNQRRLESVGEVTDGGPAARRTLEAVVRGTLPPNFFDHAIYSSGPVTLNGNAYTVTGDVLSGAVETPITNAGQVSGAITYDAAADPLPALDYEGLYTQAAAQGHVYDAARMQAVQQHQDAFPTAFWRTPPTDPADPTTGVPNIVYVTTDLQLNGALGTLGGFFVVVGDVVTDPAAVEDATLNGNGTVDGPIYTRGRFRINGGGGGLNVLGGVWAGVDATLNGNTTVAYQADYMQALQAYVAADVQMVLWRERS